MATRRDRADGIAPEILDATIPSIAMTARGSIVALCFAAFVAMAGVAARAADDAAAPIARQLLGAQSDGDGDGRGDGLRRVTGPRPLVFPADHGPHPGYRSEWWYFTGNLEAAGGRRFGFQLTFFRFALAGPGPRRESRWAARDAWMAHLAITDVDAGSFLPAERFARGALGLAGARAEPFRVWLEDWQAVGVEPGSTFPMRLSAANADGSGLDLVLEAVKPLVLQGEAGYSRKGPEPGNASHYYSHTRLEASGELRVGGVAHRVQGLAWFDREWGTSTLGPDQTGWDWFALQLSDGRDLMVYRLRGRDGTVGEFSAGAMVAPDGEVDHLARDDVSVEVLEHWQSASGGRYPARWRMLVPRAGVDVSISPLLADQEHRGAFRYWEGAVRAKGVVEGRAVTGNGYVELVGY